jgi:hypothetical protein
MERVYGTPLAKPRPTSCLQHQTDHVPPSPPVSTDQAGACITRPTTANTPPHPNKPQMSGLSHGISGFWRS